ncbi:microcin ABC transporter permease [Roseibium algicola]|jgi:microcin C transport system permease protein|uniref:Microcin ABC transporter permease n=1 Tax=Roseibium algicola TaxID=2857014 RepID=A0ABN4WUL0_9HYPH|nr:MULTISPECIES: microcin C ABC transporter permease YejB [Stappiaceae]MEC9403081.1 microcin C ABC transporter permease YejB [Pseudomonadota bacterium]AMN55241.1 microcin ABC transporter permease [Labrenzia sp. CP4]AQQ03759.1 microcin ABC transporter permease [Roseibium aggregatum]ERP97257.1 ABC transporter permease [Labrenzia sp. C1B10]ERS09062.1 ABC transporter permease [Labrenzia sp. C1B70]
MGAYILRRLLLMIPTLVGIMAINFVIIQFAPGGPVERVIAQLQGTDVSATSRISGGGSDMLGGGNDASGGSGGATADSASSKYRGAQGLDPEFIKELEAQFGFDKPPLERFLKMLGDYARFDFGESYFRDIKIIDLIAEKLPVSISLGLWMTLISYAVSIPLGIRKAVSDGSRFDVWTSGVIVVAYAIPGFLFAVLLIVLFAGGSFWDIFPLRGLVSDNWEQLSWPARIADYFWHLALPLTAMALSAFATTTLLTKNSFLDEIRKQYVITARAKGLTESQVLYGHVFRNAMLIVVAGFPGAFISSFFAGSLLIETIFSLDGLGLLSFESVINRDYAVVFATLYIFSLMGLLVNLISDLTYTWIDPRIDFESREV